MSLVAAGFVLGEQEVFHSLGGHDLPVESGMPPGTLLSGEAQPEDQVVSWAESPYHCVNLFFQSSKIFTISELFVLWTHEFHY